jgi:hypothetical protein
MLTPVFCDDVVVTGGDSTRLLDFAADHNFKHHDDFKTYPQLIKQSSTITSVSVQPLDELLIDPRRHVLHISLFPSDTRVVVPRQVLYSSVIRGLGGQRLEFSFTRAMFVEIAYTCLMTCRRERLVHRIAGRQASSDVYQVERRIQRTRPSSTLSSST